MTTSERDAILNALQAFISQRAGIEPGNYGDYTAYRAEARSVTKDRHHAEKLLSAVRWRTSICAEELKAAFPRAFSGRLSWLEIPVTTKGCKPVGQLHYCTGQYFPTEYRKAVCAVLASALWSYWRKGAENLFAPMHPNQGPCVAHSIRKSARKELGLTIATRYFDYRPSDYIRA